MTTITGSRTLLDVDPATGQTVAEVPIAGPSQVLETVRRAREALPRWAALSFEQRADLLEAAACRLEDEEAAARLAHHVTTEMGKPRAQARAEADNLAPGVRRLLAACREALAPTELRKNDTRTRITREPLGVVAAITPWNFPLSMAREVIVPALAAGNTVVFKPSEMVPLAGAALHELLAGELPEGVLGLVQGDESTGKALVAAPIDMVGFVGSVEAGRHIMAACAPALKRLVLELGGKDPMIVCADADLEAAADYAVRESMRNTGQVCCSVERIYVEEQAAQRFTQLVVEKARLLTVGDGRGDVNLGPMVSAEQRDHVLDQLRDAVQKGARVLLGGEAPDGPGFFLEPTVVDGVNEDMDLMREETFGPVATLRTVQSADEAVELANASPFGLGASVWSASDDRALALASRLEAGQVGVNRGLGGAGDLPWCGIKQSGFGFLGSPDGHRLFTRPLSVSWNEVP